MRKLLFQILALLMFCGLSGLAFAAAPVEIGFFNWSSTEDVMKPIYQVIEDFEKDNPGIKVKNIPIGVGEIRQQLILSIMGGNAPDVAQLHIGDAVTVYSMGALVPVEELFGKDFIDKFNPIFYDEGRVDDKHAAVLWSPNTMTFFYNKKLLKQLGFDGPPKTLDEMEAMMKKGKAQIPDLIGFQLDTTIRTVGFTHVWNFMNLFEYEVIKGNTSKFNSDNMVKFAEWLRRMMKEGYTLPGKRFGEFRPLAAQGRVLFCIDGAQHRGQMKAFKKDMTDEEYAETWEACLFPMGISGKPVATPDDHALVVVRSSKNKEAAAKFVEYLTASKSALNKYNHPAGFLPPVKNYEELAPGVFNDPGRQGTLKFAVPNVVNLPFGPNYVKVCTLVMTALQEVITSDKPVKGILDNCQAKLEGVLQ
jgi:multiple sugar transport system substrate-binding protein